jgi:hypothetical protein
LYNKTLALPKTKPGFQNSLPNLLRSADELAISDPNSSFQIPGRDSNSKFQILDSGFWILEFGFWILDSGIWILDSGFWNLDSGFWILDSGFWISVSLF